MRTCNILKKFRSPKRILKNYSKLFSAVEKETPVKPEATFKHGKDFYNQNFESQLKFKKEAFGKFKTFRVMDENGKIINEQFENIDKEEALKIFTCMLQIKECDARFNMAQREGKISFYMTCIGEEAATTASVAALSDEDMIFPQYREAACLIYRGFTIQEIADQLVGNEEDYGKGRQMPVHYGSKKYNYQTVSSPLCTQVPQASGAGYHYRTKNLDKVAVTYFGDGAASEGDFHAALNFASVLNSQTLFFCRNNLYAISTPVDDQYSGDGIAARGVGYGMNTLRVDGNDVFAVYNSVKKAREIMVQQKQPVLIECMTYRGGDHSTSDFSKMYRDNVEMQKWVEYLDALGCPITRFKNYLLNKGWITDNEINNIVDNAKEQVRVSLKTALSRKKPSIDSLFEDVYENVPIHLQKQKAEMKEHLAKYPEVYNVDQYKH